MNRRIIIFVSATLAFIGTGFLFFHNCKAKIKESPQSELSKTDPKKYIFDDSKYDEFRNDENLIQTDPAATAVIQNQRINRAYAVTAKRLNGMLTCAYETENGAGLPFQANWFHFGVWASRQAGQMISGKDSEVLSILKGAGFGALKGALGQTAFDTLGLKKDEDLSDRIFTVVEKELAAGNKKLAVEILPLTTSFVKLFKSNCYPEIKTAEQKLRSLFRFYNNNPTPLTIHDSIITAKRYVERYAKGQTYQGDFQDLLYHAFHSYLKAMLITDPKQTDQRTEWILLGNLLIGLQEQMILQTYIQGALGAFDSASTIYKKIMTSVLMTLKVPNTIVGCQKDVEPGLKTYDLSTGITLAPQKALFSFENVELKAIAADFGIKGVAPGASDWTDYIQRMKYISGLFINEQANITLISSPYKGFCLP
jgi:hypothetical protein